MNLTRETIKQNRHSKLITIFGTASLIIAFCLYIVTDAYCETQNKTKMVPESFSELSETVSPCVVNIRTVKTIKGGGLVFKHFFENNPFGNKEPMHDFFKRFFKQDEKNREYKQKSLGSGFIIDKKGYIVTNNHVVENAEDIKVKLKNNEEFDATIEGRDIETDIALIKIKSDKEFPAVKMGDSNTLKIGEWVVAIGSPFGLEQTVTAGIVSAKGRNIDSGPYDDFIQTDASINPGNSGGPLINMKGEVIGINTAIFHGGQQTNIGIGFAIPISLAKDIIEQLKIHGEYIRGWIGVSIQDITDDIAEYNNLKDKKGALVTKVFHDDPADKAGIEVYDVIVEVDGKSIKTSHELSKMIANIKAGDTSVIKVIRKGEEKTFEVKIGKRDIAAIFSEQEDVDELGITVTNITKEIAGRFNMMETKGVIVTAVESEKKGAKAGLMIGDIIKEINHTSIKSKDDYNKLVKGVEKDQIIKMYIRRRNKGFMVIKITK
mmetsp:Transcript_6440/g.3657  ORF Transcript_6440/g.3657 Transcript_6440/m.3657 type:complete len:491 (-) Transcript_6440:1723-3195(-)